MEEKAEEKKKEKGETKGVEGEGGRRRMRWRGCVGEDVLQKFE